MGTYLRKWRILHRRSLKEKRKNGQLVSLVCDCEKRKKIRMRHIYLYINLPHGAWAAAILSTVA